MSEGLNKVILFGHLGADPELRAIADGKSVMKIRLATTEAWIDKSGERKETTQWHRISVWGKRGEALSKMLTKGAKLLVEGRLESSSYEKDGVKKYATEIVATDVWLGGGGQRHQATNGGFHHAMDLKAPSLVDDVPF